LLKESGVKHNKTKTYYFIIVESPASRCIIFIIVDSPASRCIIFIIVDSPASRCIIFIIVDSPASRCIIFIIVDSSASRAGIKEGQILLTINGVSVLEADHDSIISLVI